MWRPGCWGEGRGEDWGGGRGEGQHFPASCSPILLPARPGSLPFSSVGTGASVVGAWEEQVSPSWVGQSSCVCVCVSTSLQGRPLYLLLCPVSPHRP